MNTKITRAALVASALIMSSGMAVAGSCTEEPQDKWLKEDEMKGKILEMGYKIDVFKVDGTCYEIYGENKDGKKVEVYFNPVTAAVVEEEVE